MRFAEFREMVYSWFGIPYVNDGRLGQTQFLSIANDAARKIATEFEWPFLYVVDYPLQVLGNDTTGYFCRLPNNLATLYYVKVLPENRLLRPIDASANGAVSSIPISGAPMYYFLDSNNSEMVLNIRPCEPTSLIAIDYYSMPDVIIDTDDNFKNQLMQWVPDLLLYRTLSLIARFVRDLDLATYFDGEYTMRFSDAVYRFSVSASGGGRRELMGAGYVSEVDGSRS